MKEYLRSKFQTCRSQVQLCALPLASCIATVTYRQVLTNFSESSKHTELLDGQVTRYPRTLKCNTETSLSFFTSSQNYKFS